MEKWLRGLLPRYRAYLSDDEQCSSFRWLGMGWDSARSKECWFVQFGKKPVKYVCWKRIKKNPFPLFLLATGWETTFVWRAIRVGTTRKPLRIDKFWRALDELPRTGKNTRLHETRTTLRLGEQL